MLGELWVEYLFLIFIGATALYFLYFAFSSFRKVRVIEDTPTSLVRSAPQGYVELVGMSSPDQRKLKAPLTGHQCLWYDYKVEKHAASDKKTKWHTLRSGTSDFSFYLVDDTGKCHLHPEGAHVVPSVKQVWYGRSVVPDTAPGIATNMFAGGQYRYTECRIHEGEVLYALGLFNTHRAPTIEEQVRDEMSDLLAIWKRDRPSLLRRFDKNKDGEIDLTEWEQARAEAEDQARAYVLETHDDSQIHILSKPNDRYQKFILSTKSPAKLASRFRRNGWMALAAFFIFLGGFGYLSNGFLFG